MDSRANCCINLIVKDKIPMRAASREVPPFTHSHCFGSLYDDRFTFYRFVGTLSQ